MALAHAALCKVDSHQTLNVYEDFCGVPIEIYKRRDDSDGATGANYHVASSSSWSRSICDSVIPKW